MRADLEVLFSHLREGTGRVELDLPPAMTSGSIEVAARYARERRSAISRGERAAYLSVAPDASRTLSITVSEDESRALLAAGATWIGPPAEAPKPLRAQPTRMITRLSLRDFKAHRATELQLERLTMLVGDNASGKTSVLDALAIQGSLRAPIESVLRGGWSIPNLIRRGTSTGVLAVDSSGTVNGDSWAAHLQLNHAGSRRPVVEASAGYDDTSSEPGANAHSGPRAWEEVRAVTGTAAMYRLRAEQIAAAAYSAESDPRIASDGMNTAVVLAAMKLGDDERFELIEEAMRRLVPSLQRIRIRSEKLVDHLDATGEPLPGSKIYFDFHGAKDIPADGASHGTLILLALLTVLYRPGRPDLILIDDVEQALHPRAQRELVQLLKNLLAQPEFSDLQIVGSTHSPYVLDLLEPSAVHAFALRDDGTVASKRLSEHPEAERMTGSLTSGQLWSLDEERNWVLQ